MKNKIKKSLLFICLTLNIVLIVIVINLNNDIKNVKENNYKINKNIEHQNEIISRIQQDYDTLKFEFDGFK